MGKQVRFYTLPMDETRLVNFVLSLPEVHFIKTKTSHPRIEEVDPNSISNLGDPSLRHIFIAKKSIKIHRSDNVEIRATTYSEENMDFVETGEIFYSISTNAPVIEFSRSFIREDNKLAQGRIWSEFFRLVDNQLVYKGDDFKDLFETLASWIKKNFKKLKGVDGYFGTEALEWFNSGGKTFP